MVKLVMADLDDTLIPFGADHASASAISAIHSLLDAGIHFGPVTGRVPATMERMFQNDVACYQTGAFANGQIVTVDGKTIQRVMISGEALRKVSLPRQYERQCMACRVQPRRLKRRKPCHSLPRACES